MESVTKPCLCKLTILDRAWYNLETKVKINPVQPCKAWQSSYNETKTEWNINVVFGNLVERVRNGKKKRFRLSANHDDFDALYKVNTRMAAMYAVPETKDSLHKISALPRYMHA